MPNHFLKLENSWLLSSGFAEGKPGQHILTPAMRGVPADGGITVCARFATERAIERVVMPAASVLGGMSFIESPEVAYLLGATRVLADGPLTL